MPYSFGIVRIFLCGFSAIGIRRHLIRAANVWQHFARSKPWAGHHCEWSCDCTSLAQRPSGVGPGSALALFLACFLALAARGSAFAHEPGSHGTTATSAFTPIALTIPDIDVEDQNGRKLKFFTDLVKDKAVAINFIFTACKTTCPMLTATFGAVQETIGDRLGGDLFLISITLDPENDSALELSAYAQKFGARPGWAFVTGRPADMAKLLKALNANMGARDDHTAIALIGNGGANIWRRSYGLDSAPVLTAALQQAATTLPAAATPQPKVSTASYFTNLPLLDQQGRAVRFYDDMVHDRLVMITSFYTSCGEICPVAVENLRQAQARLPEAQARNTRIIAISVDPEHDRPEQLRKFAEDHGLDDRWTLLTGKKENVDWVLNKLGLYVEDIQQHDTRILIGNDRTGSWIKLWAMSSPAMIERSILIASKDKVTQ